MHGNFSVANQNVLGLFENVMGLFRSCLQWTSSFVFLTLEYIACFTNLLFASDVLRNVSHFLYFTMFFKCCLCFLPCVTGLNWNVVFVSYCCWGWSSQSYVSC